MKFLESSPLKFSATSWLVLCLLICSALFPLACHKKAPVKIGFLGGLTGRVADLGMAGRDGAMLAIEQFNSSGGLRGQPVTLLTADDRQRPDAAHQALQSLIDAGCLAIIGPMTSQMAIATLPLSQQAGIALLSPTTSTDLLSGLDDNFFRLYPSNRETARYLAELAYRQLHLRRIIAVWDQDNRAHTATWLANFEQAFTELGGEIITALPIVSRDISAFAELAEQVAAQQADALFILANAIDTGLICQNLAKKGVKSPVLASEWSTTSGIVSFGGRAIEGLICLQTVKPNDRSPQFLAFSDAFRQRFGYEPGFAAVHSYDAATILFQALQRSQRPSEVIRYLKTVQHFPVLQGTLQIDRRGDVQRELFPVIIRNGHIQALEIP